MSIRGTYGARSGVLAGRVAEVFGGNLNSASARTPDLGTPVLPSVSDLSYSDSRPLAILRQIKIAANAGFTQSREDSPGRVSQHPVDFFLIALLLFHFKTYLHFSSTPFIFPLLRNRFSIDPSQMLALLLIPNMPGMFNPALPVCFVSLHFQGDSCPLNFVIS
jgi:hypothetical protein